MSVDKLNTFFDSVLDEHRIENETEDPSESDEPSGRIDSWSIKRVHDLLEAIVDSAHVTDDVTKAYIQMNQYRLTESFRRVVSKRVEEIVSTVSRDELYRLYHRWTRSFLERINVPVHFHINHSMPGYEADEMNPPGCVKYKNPPWDQFGIHLVGSGINPRTLLHEYGHCIHGLWRKHVRSYHSFYWPDVFPGPGIDDARTTLREWMDRRFEPTDDCLDFLATFWFARQQSRNHRTMNETNHDHRSIFTGVLYAWAKGFVSHRQGTVLLLLFLEKKVASNRNDLDPSFFWDQNPSVQFPYKMVHSPVDEFPLYDSFFWVNTGIRCYFSSNTTPSFWKRRNFIQNHYQRGVVYQNECTTSRVVTVNPLEYNPYNSQRKENHYDLAT